MGLPDVDIDVADREKVVKLIPGLTPASQVDGLNDLHKHNTGIYLQRIPVDPYSDLSAFPYDIAEELGYYKIDIIPFNIYQMVEDRDHLIGLVNIVESDEFPWEWFADKSFFNKKGGEGSLTHLGRYYDLCQKYPPASVLDVAALIALIRPSKKHLIGEPWEVIEANIWKRNEDDDGYFFKKSHAVGYALAVCVHMLLLSMVDTEEESE